MVKDVKPLVMSCTAKEMRIRDDHKEVLEEEASAEKV
jgi:hypothetical protein